MRTKVRAPWRVFMFLALAAAGIAALAATTGTASASRHAMHPATVNLYRSAGTPMPGMRGSVVFTCQTPKNAFCYGPEQMRAAYGVEPLLSAGYDGSGRTIAIIDAYGSPTIQSDLALFDSIWGLPAADFQRVAPFGVDATTPANAAGWSGETSLDVEWAHAIAPGAKILLVVAKSNDDSDILDATQWVLDHNAGDVVSQSYGEAEQCMDSTQLSRQHDLFQQMTAQGVTLFASSGDQGAGIPTCDTSARDEYFKATSTPASDPYVTSVGGTSLHAQGISGAYQSESTWNESALLGDAVAGGGGVSVVYSTPDYQQGVNHGAFRTVPDVSYNAGIFTGVIAVWTQPTGQFWLFGGTSAGSPQWAALAAIADQLAGQRLGLINPTLYAAGTGGNASTFFHDVADGSDNSVPNFLTSDGSPDGSITGFAAVPGYDLATGLGTPIADHLVPWLGSNAFSGHPNYHGNERGVGHHKGHKSRQ
jgi:subtilase family serine protease